MPSRCYFKGESAGNLEPDTVVQQGIKVLQQKLATVIQDLTEGDGRVNGMADAENFGPRSPEHGLNGNGWEDQGYTTPYGNGGQGGTWGQGAATPYGATPYGQPATNGWS